MVDRFLVLESREARLMRESYSENRFRERHFPDFP